MIDQAAALRDLVRQQSAAQDAAKKRGSLPLTLVVGSKGGVGATTVAVYLSASLARLGRRPLLIDADLYRSDAATICGVTEGGPLVDETGGCRDLETVVRPGPCGLSVLPGIWPTGKPVAVTDATWHRIRRSFESLADRLDHVVIDSGSGHGEVRRKMWADADDVIVVTRPNDLAVMDAYALIKIMREATLEDRPTRLHLVVNGVSHAAEGADVFARIDRSCQRFLGLRLNDLGAVVEQAAFQSAREFPAALAAASDFTDMARRFQQVLSESREAAA